MDLLKPLIALLAIVNPIGVVPFFIHFTQHLDAAARRRTIRVSSFSAFLVIAISALAGLKVIEFFGISLASFQVGGGTLLLISALQMLNAQPAESRSDDVSEGRERADSGDSIAVVPLTIPLLTGPGTVSTVIIYADQGTNTVLMLLGAGLVMGAVVWFAFSLAGPISRLAGRTGLNILTRLMGLVLAALAVEFIAAGIRAYVNA